MSKEGKNVLEVEKEKMPVFLFPLTKDQQKIESTFQKNLASVFAVLKDNKFQPASGIPASEMSDVIDEFFKEEVESKKKEAKDKLKALLQSKVKFDKTIAEESRKFQAIIIEKKKEFNVELQSVLDLIQGVDNMRIDFLKSLNQSVDIEVKQDNEEEIEN